MKGIKNLVVLSTVSVVLSTGLAFAQDRDYHRDDHHDGYADHDHDHYVHHDEWRRGYHMRHEDWDRGRRVEWRAYHLRRPPRGYEWRELDGNYVLANIHTGIINTVIVARR